MAKNCVLLSGPTIAYDEKLKEELEEFAVVLSSDDNSQIELILSDNKVDLILLEVSKANSHETELIKCVKTQFPNVEIIFINGNGESEVIAMAFAHGAKDAFRKPYKTTLIVERVKGILDSCLRN